MYGLTSAEYQTVRAILDHPRGSERERIASSNVPSSTYSTARRRIFGEGWLSDLMIPNPGPTGMTGVELRLSRPSMDERRPIATAWREDQDCVILWEGIHVLFGIFFRHGKRSPPLDRAAGSPAFRVLASRSQGAVPVFFDYSGLWDHFGGAGPPPTYPAGLDLSTPAVGDRMIEASGDLLVRNGDPTPGTSRWLPILRTSRRHRELLEAGVMQPRTVLDPARVPPYDGRRLGEVIFVHGVLRPGRSASGLLEVLTTRCGVYPFLLAESEGKLLLAGVGQTLVEGHGRLPAPSARAPVTPVLSEHLDHAEIFMEPGESLRKVVDHRYGGRGESADPGPLPPKGAT